MLRFFLNLDRLNGIDFLDHGLDQAAPLTASIMAWILTKLSSSPSAAFDIAAR